MLLFGILLCKGENKMEKGNGKKKLIIIIAAAVALIGIIVAVILILVNRKDAYRIIKVYEIQGEAIIERAEIGEIAAYENMVLSSGDKIMMNQGTMTLQLDNDKYVYVEEGSEFELQATGDANNSKTVIYLTRGAITNEIQNKLSADASYEVNTPNSTMAVRGTVFYVSVFEDDDGVFYTKVCVFDGTVETNLVYADGTIADEAKIVDVDYGNQVVIFEDTETTDYLDGMQEIDYQDLPDTVKQVVENIIDDTDIIQKIQNSYSGNSSNSDNGNGSDDVDYGPGPFTVTFLYNGAFFGSQEVEKGTCVQEPLLMPEPSGHWDFDFSTAIIRDTEITWVSE
ncbi:MAG: FecR domain-containing protein [Lachnospiraceae bacterium]